MFKIVIVICALCANVVAQLFLRKGMMNIEINSLSLSKLLEVLSSLYVWMGLFFYGISFVLYLYILTKFEVSYIYPIIMSIGFVLLLIFSVLLFGEAFTLKKVLGILIIAAGIIIITSS